MSRNRLSLLLAVVAMAVVAVGGFFLAVQPQLAQASAAQTQETNVEHTNHASRVELARLREQAAKLPAMREELAQLSASVPDGADLSSFIADLDATASASGMEVSSYTTSDAVAYAPVAPAAAPSAAPSATPSAGSSAAPAATAPTAPAAPAVVTNGAITGEDFSVIPVTVAVDGTFEQALAFLNGVQHGKRLFLVTSIASTEKSGEDGTASDQSTWTFGGSVYVLADSSRTAAAAPANG
jgi:Tfp pilus assembly protein PilO